MIISKVLRQRDMRDPRWTTKDKLIQYRGVLRLYGREKTRKYRDATTRKNKISWQLTSLRKDVNEYRVILRNKALHGCDRHVQAVLQDRVDLRYQCRRYGIEGTCAALQEENFCKRRLLDRLHYTKEKKIEQCLALQLERVELTNRYAKESEGGTATDRTKQILVTRYQRSMARQNAAKAIYHTYTSVLTILQKDAVYHESLLNELRKDQREQCTVILRATLMGQLATENYDDIATKYKRIAHHVYKAMKVRERGLSAMRDQVDNLWGYCKSLIRTESTPDISDLQGQLVLKSHATLDNQVESLEQVFHNIKESLLANSYLELFSRLEEQAKQRKRLFQQFERNTKERELCMTKRATALNELSTLERVLILATQKYRTEVQTLEQQIEQQQRREEAQKKLWKSHGELILEIKAALRNMVGILITVRKGGRSRKEEKDEIAELEKGGTIEKTETDGLNLLSDVSRRVGILFGMSNFDLEPENEVKAKDMYRTYVSTCRSKMTFGRSHADSTSFFVEHEAFDPSVPTRAQVKLRSKQVLEAYTKLD